MTIDMALPYEEAVHMLGAWGYLTANNVANLLVAKTGDDALLGAIIEFKARWGGKYGLSTDDKLDEETAKLMKRRFCNCPDEPLSIDGNLRRWDGCRIGWCSDVRVGTLDFLAAQQFTRDQTSAACGLRLEIRGSGGGRCNIVSDERAIDGPGGVLAQAYLPGFPSSAATAQLMQEYDTGEAGRLNQHAFNIVTLHETGHSLGLDHDSDPSVVAVMDPFLNESLTGWLQPDIAELQARYGAPGSNCGQSAGTDPVEEMCPEVFAIARTLMRASERGTQRAIRQRATGG